MARQNEGDRGAFVPLAYLESDAGDAALSANEAPTFNSRVHIRVISYRRRNHDPDGLSVKAALDGLVALGILADDSSKQVASVSFESRKEKDERTIIEITEA